MRRRHGTQTHWRKVACASELRAMQFRRGLFCAAIDGSDGSEDEGVLDAGVWEAG
jgi:hypothetical protein